MHAAARPALLAFLLTLAACKPAAAPAAPEGAASPQPQAPAAASTPTAACPDTDFAAFLQRFASSADTQRAATANPLTMESVDAEAMPEPRRVTKQVPLAEVTFPVMPAPAQREAEGLQETITEASATDRMVKHAVPDSGVQVRYEFHAAPCWQLVRVSDDTI